MTITETKPEFTIGNWALDTKTGLKFLIRHISGDQLESSTALPTHSINDCVAIANPSYDAYGLKVDFIGISVVDAAISIHFNVTVDGTVRADHTSAAETKYIHDCLIKTHTVNYPNFDTEHLALCTACEIYYGMIV